MKRHHPLVQAAIRNFVTYNPLFLFSALLLLGGAWAVNPPRTHGGRDRETLFELFGAVQLYELVLLGAAALLARRAGLARDVRNLSLVLAPFLMDISCTNALTAEQTGTWGGHVLAILGLLAGVAGKGWLATRLVGVRFDALTWAALLAGPLAVTAAPLSASFLAHHGFTPAEEALAAGLTLAGLILLWGAAHARAGADAPALRALAPIVLGVATWHALGTAWAHTGSLLYVLGPALIALGPVLPRLAWPALAARDVWTPLLLPAAGAFLCGLPGVDGREPWLGGSAWQLGLIGLALTHTALFARHRGVGFLLGVLAACDLLAAGATLERSFDRVGDGPAEPAVLLALFGYALAQRAHPVLTLSPLALAAALAARLGVAGGPLDALVGLDVLGAGLLAWTHRAHGKGAEGTAWRFVGCALLWFPAHVLALRGGSFGEPALLFGRVALVGLVVLGLATRLRGYAVPALLLPLEGLRHATPSSTAGWGALGITGAFVAVGLGVLVSLKREALLAWLEQDGPDRDEEAPPAAAPTPIAVPAGGSSRGAVVAACVLGALFVPLVVLASPGKARRLGNEAAAIGALKTLYTAQTLFREGDKDHDGVLDYGTLGELGDALLIDQVLARGERQWYRFELSVHPEHPEFMWMAVANPLHPEPGQRSFAVNHQGVVVYDTRPIAVNQACELPATRYRALGK